MEVLLFVFLFFVFLIKGLVKKYKWFIFKEYYIVCLFENAEKGGIYD